MIPNLKLFLQFLHLVALECKNYGKKWIFSKISTVVQVVTWYWGVFQGNEFIKNKIEKFWTCGGAREQNYGEIFFMDQLFFENFNGYSSRNLVLGVF